MYKKLSIVMPAYNEEKTLEEIVNRVLDVDLGIDKELIIINDCSKDTTGKIIQRLAKNPQIKGLENGRNMGKSQTVRKGLMETTGDLVVIQDADLEYDPNDLVQFVELFQQNKVDLVYGNRFGRKNKVIYWKNWIGNTFLSFVSAFFTGLRSGMWTRDMEVCYKMARGDVFREIAETVESTSGFGLEPELTAKFARHRLNGRKLRFRQLPIHYYPRSIEEGKHMSAFKDGFKALWEILKFNLLK